MTDPGAAVTGTCTLKTVNGSPLPYAFVDSVASFIIVSDVITVNKDKTWEESLSYQLDQSTPVMAEPDWDGGTWTLAGDVLTLESALYFDGTPYTATLA